MSGSSGQTSQGETNHWERRRRRDLAQNELRALFLLYSQAPHFFQNPSPVKTGDLRRLFSRRGSLNSRRCIRLYRSCWRLQFFLSIPIRESSNNRREFTLDRTGEEAFPRGIAVSQDTAKKAWMHVLAATTTSRSTSSGAQLRPETRAVPPCSLDHSLHVGLDVPVRDLTEVGRASRREIKSHIARSRQPTVIAFNVLIAFFCRPAIERLESSSRDTGTAAAGTITD